MSAYATLAQVKAALGITDTDQDAQITALLLGADAVVDAYCARPLIETAHVEYADGGGRSIELASWPVFTSPALVVRDMFTGQDVAAAAYTQDGARGLLYISPGYGGAFGSARSSWERGPNRWRITYTAGYASDSIPAEVTQAAAEIVGARLKGAGGVTGESDMGYSYQLSERQLGGESGVPPAARALLTKHRRL
jgi:hypothetical protein